MLQSKLYLSIIGLFAVALAALSCSGCTKQNWYEGVKASHEAQCMKEPISEYDSCMEQLQEQSYEDYERDRDSLK
jgi:hypothetical protein